MKQVILIEGLFGEIGAWLRTPIKKEGIDFKWYPWWMNPEIPDGAILIGHSFGAAKAIKLANSYRPSALITIDPRLEPSEGFFINYRPSIYRLEAYNFYQYGFMRGYSVMGAKNTIVGNASHTQLPSHPVVIAKIKEVIAGVNG